MEIPPQVDAQLAGLRTTIGDAVRSRIAGPDGNTRMLGLINEEGPRWFAPDSPIVRVHGDASMFIGGLRALLLQSMHPLAMAGVATHSDYRNDPWGRLQRTADFLAATTFGSARAADEAVARVRAVHNRVTGTASDGRPYSANDPHLLRWVHVAEVDSFLFAHQRFGERPLDQDERDAYVADTARVAHALGVPAPPTSERSLRDQLRMFRPELQASKEAKEAARYLVLTPPLPMPARIGYAAIAAAAISTLPRWVRMPLRLPYVP
ncbi:MAG: oxygenase MpaB family protein, partial [Actinomycetota bacterium]